MAPCEASDLDIIDRLVEVVGPQMAAATLLKQIYESLDVFVALLSIAPSYKNVLST